MKLLTHPASTAFGLSVLCCFGIIGPVISPDHLWIYHDSGSPSSIFLPIIFDLAILWLFFLLLLLLAQMPGRIRVAIWSAFILIFPWLLLEDGDILQAWTVPHRLGVALLLCSGLGWIAVNLFWRPSFLPHFERIVRLWKSAFGFVALSNLLVVSQLLWYFWEARDIQSPRPLHVHAAQASVDPQTQPPRVIWIILDELSYQQVYERRFPGLALPAFDQLAAQSTVFTHVLPAAMFTEAAVPSFMSGLPVDIVRADADGVRLSLHDPVTNQWQPFNPQDTIFQDAIDHGYSTAVVGWHNPYCRTLPEVLDHCYWTFNTNYDKWIFGGASTLANTLVPLRRAMSRMPRGARTQQFGQQLADAHIADYRQLRAVGDRFLADPSITFLLLHMPIPHPGGIYDRKTGVLTDHGTSYVDNLALADLYLAHVRQLLQQRGEWDSSAIVVMGDHSWRTARLWFGTSLWMPEDQLASRGGQFDDRPAYIVKLPHQTEGTRIEEPFASPNTRALLKGILTGSIRSPQDLADFAKDRPEQRP